MFNLELSYSTLGTDCRVTEDEVETLGHLQDIRNLTSPHFHEIYMGS